MKKALNYVHVSFIMLTTYSQFNHLLLIIKSWLWKNLRHILRKNYYSTMSDNYKHTFVFARKGFCFADAKIKNNPLHWMKRTLLIKPCLLPKWSRFLPALKSNLRRAVIKAFKKKLNMTEIEEMLKNYEFAKRPFCLIL